MTSQPLKNNSSSALWFSVLTLFFSLFIFSADSTAPQRLQTAKTEITISVNDRKSATAPGKNIVAFYQQTYPIFTWTDLKCFLVHYDSSIKINLKRNSVAYCSFKSKIHFFKIAYTNRNAAPYTISVRG